VCSCAFGAIDRQAYFCPIAVLENQRRRPASRAKLKDIAID